MPKLEHIAVIAHRASISPRKWTTPRLAWVVRTELSHRCECKHSTDESHILVEAQHVHCSGGAIDGPHHCDSKRGRNVGVNMAIAQLRKLYNSSRNAPCSSRVSFATNWQLVRPLTFQTDTGPCNWLVQRQACPTLGGSEGHPASRTKVQISAFHYKCTRTKCPSVFASRTKVQALGIPLPVHMDTVGILLHQGPRFKPRHSTTSAHGQSGFSSFCIKDQGSTIRIHTTTAQGQSDTKSQADSIGHKDRGRE
jgi:hypothetical protein